MIVESRHLVIFSTSGKFVTKFNVLRCISLSETLFWTLARDRILITLSIFFILIDYIYDEFDEIFVDSIALFFGSS